MERKVTITPVEPLIMQIDKTDGAEVYIPSGLVRSGAAIFQKENGEMYLVQFYDAKIEPKDKRPEIIRMTHILTEKIGRHKRKSHDANFCLHWSNHSKLHVHLNLSGLSKIECKNCEVCNKYVLPLNHFEIISINGTGGGNIYKLPNLEKTFSKFVDQMQINLNATGFKLVMKNITTSDALETLEQHLRKAGLLNTQTNKLIQKVEDML